MPIMNCEKAMAKFVGEFGVKGSSLVPARLQSMLALLESLRNNPELTLSQHLSDAGQSVTSHETLGAAVHKRLELTVLN